MPLYSNMRKSSTTVSTTDPHHSYNSAPSNGVPPPRRTTASGRAIRPNANRPANYYARPFGSMSGAADNEANMDNAASLKPQNFYPGLQYFTDAITALPKEVMKQVTLMKEVEAKVHGPTEHIGELIDQVMQYPVPTRRAPTNAAAPTATGHGLLNLTANNSTSGSANASLINGVGGGHSAHPSVSGSLDGEHQPETQEERERRGKYAELRMTLHGLLGNQDEKMVVLSEANRVLKMQESRIDSVLPQIETEISEEARLGSMSHWAYSDNRQKTKTTASGVNRPRDIAATNSLAAAANIFHEAEIAQARTNAGKEATREKTKGKRTTEHAGDSDFDDKPRKAPKMGRGKAAANATAAGLGITANGEQPTRRKKGEKALGAPSMERTASGRGVKSKDTPRSTPAAAEPVAAAAKSKATKAKSAPAQAKKKLPASAQNSPMLASSPLAASFSPAFMEAAPGARPTSSRLRQNSAATNLRHERLQDEDEALSRPSSAAGKVNGEKMNGRRKVQETTEEHEALDGDERPERHPREQSQKLKREDTEMRNASGSDKERPGNSRSGSNSRKNSGRTSKMGTPRSENFPPDAVGEHTSRSRVRKNKPGERDSTSSEPRMQGTGLGKHKRHASNSHLVKQLAPFNRSPDIDRHKNRDDMDLDLDSDDEEEQIAEPEEHEDEPEEAPETRRASVRRPVSRRNTATSSGAMRTSPAPLSRESSPPASPPPTSTRQNTRSSQRGATAASPPQDLPLLEPDEEDEESEHELEGDDADEARYCYCNRTSYGEMVACDNEHCPKEWFHLGCTELKEAPGEEEKWYCKDCRPKNRGRGGGRGRGGSRVGA